MSCIAIPRTPVEQPLNQSFRLIGLTQGQVTKLDVADFERLSRHNWYASWSRNGKSFYARSSSDNFEGCGYRVELHRYLLGYPKELQVDHINGDTLDNRRCNLRLATHAQNQMNKKLQVNNKSGHKGVFRSKNGKMWHAAMSVNGRTKFLGARESIEDAAELVRISIRKLHGEFARFE